MLSRCIDQVKGSQYMELAHSLEIDKAIGYLKEKDFQQVWPGSSHVFYMFVVTSEYWSDASLCSR